jgi:hypothetical protein
LQEADIRVDEGFVTHVMAAMQEVFSENASVDEEVEIQAVPVPDYRRTKLATGDMVYARVLYIGPISLQVSYSSCPWAKVLRFSVVFCSCNFLFIFRVFLGSCSWRCWSAIRRLFGVLERNQWRVH